jgi:hypothetical protein
MRRPKEVTSSDGISKAMRTIQRTFITPPTNNSVVTAQQQPTQYAPWRSPSNRLPAASRRKPPWRIKNANGVWHSARQMSLSPLIAARRDEQDPSDDFARVCHRGIEHSGKVATSEKPAQTRK